MRSQAFTGSQAGSQASSQRSQSGRQERLDGRFLRTPRAGAVASGAYGQREELSGAGTSGPTGTPGKLSPAIFALLGPKPPLRSFTKSIQSSPTGKPSKRTGPVSPAVSESPQEGLRRLLSEPTPSHRLWATAPGATPAQRIEHNTSGCGDCSKPELSTLLESGTFYFALTAIFRSTLRGRRVWYVLAGPAGQNIGCQLCFFMLQPK